MPVLVYNSTEGDADAAVRERYGEPSWNYPVMRVLDAGGEDLIPRVADRWDLAGMTFALTRGLEAAGQPVPEYLSLLDAEASARQAGVQTAVFGMW